MGLEAKGMVDNSSTFEGMEMVERAVEMVPPEIDPLTEWTVVELAGSLPFSTRALAER